MCDKRSLKRCLTISLLVLAIECTTASGGNRASNPDPPDGGRAEDPMNVVLTWTPGDTAILHDVYFGTDYWDVVRAERSDMTGIYRCLTGDPSYQVPVPMTGLAWGTYYWRIDERELVGGGYNIVKGDVWAFRIGTGIIYVDADAIGTNNGVSWTNAFKYLQDALIVAEEGDVIWVAEGSYRPDQDKAHPYGTLDRNATFNLKDHISIFGGFAGTETQKDQRDWEAHKTILTGTMTTPLHAADSYHVVTALQETGWFAETNWYALDGFTITGGRADGEPPDDVGGGIWRNGGTLQVRNCTITGNWAESGGGMYTTGDASLTIDDCIFQDNIADANGGGIANTYYGRINLFDSTFVGNSAGINGGGMHNVGDSQLRNCVFNGNSAGENGGGMCNFNYSDPRIIDCTFSGNSASENGGGMYNFNHSNPRVSGCTFSANSTSKNGGGMYNFDQSDPCLTDCTFKENTAERNGGGMYNTENSWPETTDCTFRANKATWNGGGMCNDSFSNPFVIDCEFDGNGAGLDGGGMYNDYSMPFVSDCIFNQNDAHLAGGGMYSMWATTGIIVSPLYLDVRDCTFNRNTAGYHGGGMYNNRCHGANTSGCMFTRNTAVFSGGGMYNFKSLNISAPYCKYIRNEAEDSGGGLCNDESGIYAQYSVFTLNIAGQDGGGMDNSDSEALIANSAFMTNTAGRDGGAINNISSTLQYVISCTFANNEAGNKGGAFLIDEGTMEIENGIVWGNTASTGNQIALNRCDLSTSYSDLRNTPDSVYIEGGSTVNWGDGMIDADPLFADSDGRLSSSSPCIDAGDSRDYPFTIDLDSNPRFVDYPGKPNTGIGDPPFMDMGAYECQVMLGR